MVREGVMFDDLRTCPDCGKRVKKYGEPTLHGHFLDQIIHCPCGWCGVMTEWVEEYIPKPTQMEMFP